MAGNRNQTAERREITVERNGKTYRAQYHVTSEMVTVEATSAAGVERIATQVGTSTARHIAARLLNFMIDAGLL